MDSPWEFILQRCIKYFSSILRELLIKSNILKWSKNELCKQWILLQNKSTSIPNGDPEKVFENASTATRSYQPNIGDFRPNTHTDPYTQLYKTTFTLKDGLGFFDKYRSTTKDSYQPQPLYGKHIYNL